MSARDVCKFCRTPDRACDHQAEHYPWKPCCRRCLHPVTVVPIAKARRRRKRRAA
jgi:hypothetical protein